MIDRDVHIPSPPSHVADTRFTVFAAVRYSPMIAIESAFAFIAREATDADVCGVCSVLYLLCGCTNPPTSGWLIRARTHLAHKPLSWYCMSPSASPAAGLSLWSSQPVTSSSRYIRARVGPLCPSRDVGTPARFGLLCFPQN